MKRDSVTISKIMASVRSKGTRPEIQLKKYLRLIGRRFRSHPANIPGRPDFIFPKERVAVFLDGDFWHGHQWRVRALPSLNRQFSASKNKAYWIEKIKRNVARDRRITRRLHRLGWHVVRLWESDLKKDFVKCLKRVQRKVEDTL